jgi:hypothetical protein
MVTLTCTLKLAKRLPFSVVDNKLPTTNRLGDWCANSFNLGRYPFILITNDRTFLSVVIPFKDSVVFWPRFLLSLETLLKAIGISDNVIKRELQEYRELQITRQTNRRTLGVMNDFVFQVRARFQIDVDPSLENIGYELSDMPCGPLKYGNPREAVRNLLLAAAPDQESRMS